MPQAIERVGMSHPECCEDRNVNSQCEYRRVTGSRFCPVHAGGNAEKQMEKRELLNLKINTVWGDRAKEIAGKSSVKNLTDEIALMRVTLESMFNTIETPREMLLYVDKIDKMSNGIMKLIESWQKIQEKNKELLGRETVISIFDQLIEVIVANVSDPDTLKKLADEAHGIITKALASQD